MIQILHNNLLKEKMNKEEVFRAHLMRKGLKNFKIGKTETTKIVLSI
jgi:hypothetical protein